ncbi:MULTISPECIES: hypothetical protein [Hydrogenophaga]|jgi:hypothetical protein|uniref:Uncharacterized protein n=1 Tax=Hydrogenophaga intermedia TaxID=65786 RepID=A0A1L1PN00_HYDIT|nr:MULTISPECIES: hypothetical protein [Hydrogenophaga]CDN85951.1 hypothetical protein BN948_00349 [Hydrogenophaga intermedia]
MPHIVASKQQADHHASNAIFTPAVLIFGNKKATAEAVAFGLGCQRDKPAKHQKE